jgi:hypothetical protein
MALSFFIAAAGTILFGMAPQRNRGHCWANPHRRRPGGVLSPPSRYFPGGTVLTSLPASRGS